MFVWVLDSQDSCCPFSFLDIAAARARYSKLRVLRTLLSSAAALVLSA